MSGQEHLTGGRMQEKHKLLKAKAKAAGLRKEPNRLNTETNEFHEYGFNNALEFIHYHWSKLSEKNRQDLLKAGVAPPIEEKDGSH